jgi:hypothetical protein
MPSLASYCFKPKCGPEIAYKIIERFCDKFLSYDHEGFYLYWRKHEPNRLHRPVPEGWVEFYVDTDNGNLEAYSETCYWEEEVDGCDLTEHFFAMLGEDFWHKDDDGETFYSMYERELFEIVQALSAEDSRTIAWGGDRTAYISYKDETGERAVKHLDMLDFAMTVPIVKEEQTNPQGRQLQLAF